MTQEDQETLNEMFLGKEDPDMAFKRKGDNMKKRKTEIRDETLYYKSIRLASTGIVVEVKEKSPWDDGAISLFHSPARFDQGHNCLLLRDRQDLKDYIAMLQDFDERFGEQLDDIKRSEEAKKTL